MIHFIKSCVQNNKFEAVIHPSLEILGNISRFIPSEKHKKLILEGRMFYAKRHKNLHKIEDILIEYCAFCPPPLRLLSFYNTHVVASGSAQKIRELTSASFFPKEALPLLMAGQKWSQNDTEGALQTLEAECDSFKFRHEYALLRRKIFHQQQDQASVALSGITFLEQEPDEILIPFTINAAAAAEASNNEDVFARAIQRLSSDTQKVIQNSDLFAAHWKDAILASITLFDLEKALFIAQKACNLKALKSAQKQLLKITDLAAETYPFRNALREANQDILVRAGLLPSQETSPTQCAVVFPAAALRSNAIDYKGFREDLRLILGESIAFLEANTISYNVKGRIKTHGTIDLPTPFISYHTISENGCGLHFKETDRPHCFSFDTQGYAGWSRFSQMPLSELELESVDTTQAESFFREEQHRIFASKLSKYQQINSKEQLPARYVFVALQVMGDAVQQLAFTSPIAMLEEVVAACQAQDIQVVVKRHPMCSSAQIAQYLNTKEAEGHIIVAQGNIHDIIKDAMAVCTVNSGVGAEALLYEKPVFVFGRSDYMQACFICKETGDFTSQFQPGKLPLSLSDLHKFWWLLRNEYAYSTSDKEAFRAFLHRKLTAFLRGKNINI